MHLRDPSFTSSHSLSLSLSPLAFCSRSRLSSSNPLSHRRFASVAVQSRETKLLYCVLSDSPPRGVHYKTGRSVFNDRKRFTCFSPYRRGFRVFTRETRSAENLLVSLGSTMRPGAMVHMAGSGMLFVLFNHCINLRHIYVALCDGFSQRMTSFSCPVSLSESLFLFVCQHGVDKSCGLIIFEGRRSRNVAAVKKIDSNQAVIG